MATGTVPSAGGAGHARHGGGGAQDRPACHMTAAGDGVGRPTRYESVALDSLPETTREVGHAIVKDDDGVAENCARAGCARSMATGRSSTGPRSPARRSPSTSGSSRSTPPRRRSPPSLRKRARHPAPPPTDARRRRRGPLRRRDPERSRVACQSEMGGWHPGQLLFVGFARCGAAGRLGAERSPQGRVGGAILFARNVESPEQVRRLVSGAAPTPRRRRPPAQRWPSTRRAGRVQRLRAPWTEWPPMRRIGERRPARKTAEPWDAAWAGSWRISGIDLDFTPCVDVDTNPDNPVIGDRSFARSPEGGGRARGGPARGAPGRGSGRLRQAFPRTRRHAPRQPHRSCLGSTTIWSGCAAWSCRPSGRWPAAGVASMMTAHVIVSCLDSERPATLAPDALRMLREDDRLRRPRLRRRLRDGRRGRALRSRGGNAPARWRRAATLCSSAAAPTCAPRSRQALESLPDATLDGTPPAAWTPSRPATPAASTPATSPRPTPNTRPSLDGSRPSLQRKSLGNVPVSVIGDGGEPARRGAARPSRPGARSASVEVVVGDVGADGGSPGPGGQSGPRRAGRMYSWPCWL